MCACACAVLLIVCIGCEERRAVRDTERPSRANAKGPANVPAPLLQCSADTGKIKNLGLIKSCVRVCLQMSCVVDAFWAKNTNLDAKCWAKCWRWCGARVGAWVKKAGSGLAGLKAGCDRFGSSRRARIGSHPIFISAGTGHDDHFRAGLRRRDNAISKKKGTVSFASSLFSQEARFAAYSLVAWQHTKSLEAFQFAMILPECRYAPIAPTVHVESHLLSAF